MIPSHEEQALIWDYYKPRHTHSWNMLVRSWHELDQSGAKSEHGFSVEYAWENFIIRLWLYRTAVKTLTKIEHVMSRAQIVLSSFDGNFEINGKNGLKALRDMIEHFDDYAAGEGRGPAQRNKDLDPWRSVTVDRYERGQFYLDRKKSYEAAITMRDQARSTSKEFTDWYKNFGS